MLPPIGRLPQPGINLEEEGGGRSRGRSQCADQKSISSQFLTIGSMQSNVVKIISSPIAFFIVVVAVVAVVVAVVAVGAILSEALKRPMFRRKRPGKYL